ncbi:MAG TPA: proliferating cell nuclear antigen (pcna) [Candidatus Thermoplasmatota archaeon]|nr:proliferating cell nuclear antigen (pcna) [Candidatus Thermoplasmatota archaeon]
MAFQSKLGADTLRSIIDSVGILVDEAKIRVAKDGLSLKAVDPAHVAMVELTLGKGAFDDFNGDEGEFGVDLEKLKEILKLAGSDDDVNMKLDTTNNKLEVRIGNLTRRMSLVDVSGMTDPKVPKLELPATITLSVVELERGIRAAESVSDHVALSATPEEFELTAEGDTDTVSLHLEKTMLGALTCKDKARSLFSLDYFANMVKAARSSPSLTIHLGSDYPVRVEFEIAKGNGRVTYLLAPRIESQ